MPIGPRGLRAGQRLAHLLFPVFYAGLARPACSLSGTCKKLRCSAISDSELLSLRAALLRWFGRHARQLPWRVDPRDPYAVWVSEVMLQQTRVGSVVPFFERFMRRFPSVSSLARADLDGVLKLWSGLGYYRRARSLHTAACEIVARHNAAIPNTFRELLRLPGVGNYTAAAIASIAFAQPVAVIDGNVCRVLARLRAIRRPVDGSSSHRAFAAVAQRLVPKCDPGRFNEAMMELGALVCTPKRPSCEKCPWRKHCQAHRLRLTHLLPVVRPRAAPRRIKVIAVAARTGDKILMAQRCNEGLLAGLWEPPLLNRSTLRQLKILLGKAGAPGSPERIATVRHTLTHRLLDVQILRVEIARAVPLRPSLLGTAYQRCAWVLFAQTHQRGVSALARKILRLVEQHETNK